MHSLSKETALPTSFQKNQISLKEGMELNALVEQINRMYVLLAILFFLTGFYLP